MSKCPYCARPLRMGGLKCHTCRRFVLRRWHVLLLIAVAFTLAFGLLELIEHLTPPPLKTR